MFNEIGPRTLSPLPPKVLDSFIFWVWEARACVLPVYGYCVRRLHCGIKELLPPHAVLLKENRRHRLSAPFPISSLIPSLVL